MTSSLNRESIRQHGLDWTLVASARGIAGSIRPEQPGIFLALDEFERDWFIALNNTGGPVDVWAVDGVDTDELVESPEHHFYLPRAIPSAQVRLIRQDVEPEL